MESSRVILVGVCCSALVAGAAPARAVDCLSPVGRYARGWTEAVAARDGTEFIIGNGSALLIRTTDGWSATYSEFETGAMVLGITVADDYAYVVGDGGLRIFDLLATGGPTVVGSCPMPGVAEDVEVLDGLAYVAGGDWGMRVVDVSVPTAPRVVGATDTPGWAADIAVDAVDGTPVVVVADSEQGVLIIDATDPGELEIAFVEDLAPVFTVDAADGHAHAASPSGLGMSTVDISVPAQPEIVGSWFSDGGGIGYWHSGLAVEDGYAYLAGKNLYILDVQDPTQIVEIHELDIGGRGLDVAASENRIAVSSGDAVDFFSPSNPVPPGGSGLHRTTWPAFVHWVGANGMARAGEYVVGFDGPFSTDLLGPFFNPGLQVYDISQPGQPAIIGRGLTDQLILDVEAEGDLVVVVTSRGDLRIVDLTDPTDPGEIGALSDPVASMNHFESGVDLVVEGSIAAVAGDLGLVVVDITDPRNPARLGEVQSPCFGLEIIDDRAYVADDEGIHLVDLSDPSNPVVDDTARFDLQDGPSDFTIADGYAYLVSEYTTATILTIVSLDAVGPWREVAAIGVRLDDIDIGERVWSNGALSVAGDRLALALPDGYRSRGSVAIFDISDPSDPVEIARTATPGDAHTVTIDEGSLLVGDGRAGLGIYDGGSCLFDPREGPIELPHVVEDR
jgi:hypothetical protein